MKIPSLSASLLLLLPAFSQPPATPLEFEVADIRQNVSGETQIQGGILAGGQFSVRNATLKTLLGFAFEPAHQKFRDSLIVGAPSWVDTDRFDITAKAPPGTPARQCFFSNYCYPDASHVAMVRAFLEKKFKLATHVENRTINTYALVRGKGALKLTNTGRAGRPELPQDRRRHGRPARQRAVGRSGRIRLHQHDHGEFGGHAAGHGGSVCPRRCG